MAVAMTMDPAVPVSRDTMIAHFLPNMSVAWFTGGLTAAWTTWATKGNQFWTDAPPISAVTALRKTPGAARALKINPRIGQ